MKKIYWRYVHSETVGKSDTSSSFYFQILAFRIKKLHSSSASISPPNPTSILIGVSWLSGLDSEVISDVVERADLVSFDSEDVLAEPGQEICCLYVVISGIVQVR